jgi:predicted small metal-binding protein
MIGGYHIAKIIRCRDVGVDCDFEARGATEQEVLDKAAEHGRTAHGIEVLPPELVEKVRAAIREEPQVQAVGA